MITLILISAYVLNVFINRYFNKLVYKINRYNPIAPLVWFTPFPVMILIYFVEYTQEKSNWFTGKNW
jgi:hypothetical protein